jgi:transposase-like protein
VREAPTLEQGRQLAAQVIEMYERTYPAAMKSFADDLEASLAHLRAPAAHRKFVRTTNLIERAFEEQRRRTKVIPRFFDERSCLKLAFAALDRAARGWHRIHISEAEQRQVAALRRELGLDPRPAETGHHHQKIAA